jgi:hypothetical protein
MEKSVRRSPSRSRLSQRRLAAATGTTSKMRPGRISKSLDYALRMKGTLPETITSDDLEILNTGLRFFFGDLRSARREFGDNRRHGAVIALGALMRLIALFEAPFAERLDVPVLALRGELLGLDENVVGPLLKPVVSRRGPPRSSIAREALKGREAAAVQCLLQAGNDTTTAHRLVAKRLRTVGIKPERGQEHVRGHDMGGGAAVTSESQQRQPGGRRKAREARPASTV